MNRKILKALILVLGLILIPSAVITVYSAYFDKYQSNDTYQNIIDVTEPESELLIDRSDLADEELKELEKKCIIEHYDKLINEAKEKNDILDENVVNAINTLYERRQQELDSIDKR